VVGSFLLALDLGGAFVFALSGGMMGVRHRLDLFGVLVLSFTAAVVGGIIRDLLIGAIPPAAINDWRYIAVPILAGLITFFWSPAIGRIRHPVQMLDAVGLAIFAVDGASKALNFHLGPIAAAMLGMLTGIGGGMVRDLLVREIPIVLRAELYAVAAMAGASIVVVGRAWNLPEAAVAICGAAVCLGLRLMAIRYDWHLPRARSAHSTAPEPETRLERENPE